MVVSYRLCLVVELTTKGVTYESQATQRDVDERIRRADTPSNPHRQASGSQPSSDDEVGEDGY